MFIEKMNIPAMQLVFKTSWFAVEVDLPEHIYNNALRIQQEFAELTKYLSSCAQVMEGRVTEDLSIVEVPECLDAGATPVVVNESPPKKKATAATSKKKSPTASKKTASKPLTNPPGGV